MAASSLSLVSRPPHSYISSTSNQVIWRPRDSSQTFTLTQLSAISGSIANQGVPQCFYNASKGALNVLAKTLAMEWADQGILVNCLSPGFVE